MFQKGRTFDILAYFDASYACSINIRKSTMGFYVFVGEKLVPWRSQNQVVIARSSVESNYRVMARTTTEITWIKGVL